MERYEWEAISERVEIAERKADVISAEEKILNNAIEEVNNTIASFEVLEHLNVPCRVGTSSVSLGNAVVKMLRDIAEGLAKAKEKVRNASEEAKREVTELARGISTEIRKFDIAKTKMEVAARFLDHTDTALFPGLAEDMEKLESLFMESKKDAEESIQRLEEYRDRLHQVNERLEGSSSKAAPQPVTIG
ncbi:MAG: hypothetical protein QXP01_05005 [Candidatus Hadarchaeum sp.]